MPLSNADGRGWVYDRIARTISPTIVDGGCGQGTYSDLARHLRLDAKWIGLEIHWPYVDRFLLNHKYDELVCADLREWPFAPMNNYVILLGDVLEHMELHEAKELLEFHMEYADEIMVSVPIVYSPQEACYGNEHEAHVHHYHFDEMAAMLPGCDNFRGVMIGRYWWQSDHHKEKLAMMEHDL